jgi:FKBP-type peptidyl-prolyl cis-trans isomerase FklB
MPAGSEWEIYIPQNLAYGAQQSGQILPFSALIFKVELVGVK